MKEAWQRFVARISVALLALRDPEGQGMAEYALIIAFVSILVVIATKLMQPALVSTLNTVANYL